MKSYHYCVSVISLFLMATSLQAATLTQHTTSDAIDDFSMKPIGSKTSFLHTAPQIWATAYLQDAVKDTVVSAEWLYRELSGDQIYTLTRNEVKTEGTRYIAFRLAPTEGNTLPAGRYQVKFYLNDQEAGFSNFEVTQDQNAGANAVQSNANFVQYRDPQGKLTIDIPKGWITREASNRNMVLYQTLNQENEPLAMYAISIYNANLSEEYTAKNAVMSMRGILVKEGQDVGANIEKDEIQEDSPNMVVWSLKFMYASGSGKAIEDRKLIICTNSTLYVFNFVNEKDYSENMKSIAMQMINSFVAG